MAFTIRQATVSDIPEIKAVIKARIDWMDRVGIHQWNETKYLEVYDDEYFRKNINDFYVAFDGTEMVGCAAFYSIDYRWPDNKPAVYVHHLTSIRNGLGIGLKLMAHAEVVAKERGFNTIRLDSDINNTKLRDFYEAQGFIEFDNFQDGLYFGTRREKTV